jgi:hypothetical protein
MVIFIYFIYLFLFAKSILLERGRPPMSHSGVQTSPLSFISHKMAQAALLGSLFMDEVHFLAHLGKPLWMQCLFKKSQIFGEHVV